MGPGNQYVTAAKMVLQNSEAMVAIDMPAGPSEVLVIADAGANHSHVAIDLLSQVSAGMAGPELPRAGRCVAAWLTSVHGPGRRRSTVRTARRCWWRCPA